MIALLLAACAPGGTGVPDAGELAEAHVFESAEACGACHPRQYDEWRQSMHAYASLSPVLDVLGAKAFRDSDGAIGDFCTGCHSVISADLGEPGSLTAEERSPLSREGINCDTCHTVASVGVPVGNRNLELAPGPAKVGPYADPDTTSHDAAASDVLTTPEMCGSCHDVFRFPGVLMEEAYTEYVASPAREAGTRCQDCHMGPEPGVAVDRPWGPSAVVEGLELPDREQASHRFVGPDVSLRDDFPYPDDPAASEAATAELADLALELLRRGVRIGGLEASATAGGARVEVVLESLTDGHNVPTGFTPERQLWVALTVTDAAGEVVFRSGDLDAWGDLRDEHSWEVIEGTAERDEQLVNLQSVSIVIRREYEDNGILVADRDLAYTTTTIYPFEADTIKKYSLLPLERRSAFYRLEGLAPGTYDVRAELRFRSLPPYLLRALFADDLVERLPIYDIDAAEATFEVPG